METIKVAFFSQESINSPLKHLRILGPISNTDMKLTSVSVIDNEITQYINNAHIIVFQRTFPADIPLFNKIYKISRQLKKPLVYDLDDNLFILPENHPDRKSFSISRGLISMLNAALVADSITVSNNYLKQSISNLNQNIQVLPNYLDDTIWSFKSPKIQKNDNMLTIGYMGGDSHKPDIEFITPTLVQIKEQFPHKVRYHIYGVKPPDVLLSFEDTIWTPIKTYQYSEFVQDFQQIEVDFFIAPLMDNEFNRCKSPIKFFEYSAIGVPGVFSRLTPYQDVVTDGKNGFLASSIDEWRENITLLINDPDLRHQLAVNAQKLTSEKYLMSKNSGQWLKAYQNIIERVASDKKKNYVPKYNIQCITDQLHEYYTNIDIEFARYAAEINISDKALENLENEKQNLQKALDSCEQNVISYASSKSWRYTRPLRKLKRMIMGDKND